MDKIFQIFISSTYEDLKEERQIAVQKILESHCIPAGMELFTAQSKNQWEIIKKWIDGSDIYLLILGGRYGSIDNDTKISYTEMEYDYAIKQKKPIICLVFKDTYLDSRPQEIKKSFERENVRYEVFKRKVTSKTVKFIDSQEEIGFSLLQAIKEIQEDEDIYLSGWIRGDFSKIEDKFKIGELSYNELNSYLLSKVFDNYPLSSSGISSNMTALDFYKYLIVSENTFQKSTLASTLNLTKDDNTFQDFFIRKVIPIFESLGLVEYKPVHGYYMYELHFTKLGLKYNQLLCKFIDK